MIRAVLAGINAYPTSPLAGCVNDVDDVLGFLTSAGVDHGAIRVLRDGAATKQALVSAIEDMILAATPGDHLLFHYSGHGSQVLSQAVNEPDGLDECLCPVDFDFDRPETAFRDKELANLLAAVPPTVAMTVVLDSCHSGDMMREGSRTRRSFPMPPAVRARLARLTLRPKTRAVSSNTAVVSACQSNETAADTSFGGRPNGAFTYYWLSALAGTPTGALQSALGAASANLGAYGMHPMLDGATALHRSQFLADPAPVARDAQPLTATPRASTVLFDETWTPTIFGTPIAIELRIRLDGGTFWFDVIHQAGIPLHWSFPVNGDVRIPLPIGLGFEIDFRVNDWSATASAISFHLAIDVKAPFVGATTIVDQPITLARPSASRAVQAPQSAADLVAMLDLAKLGGQSPRTEVPPRVAPRDDNQYTGIVQVEHFAGGLFGARYEKNSDNNAYVPPGFIRDHVEVTLDPPGSGNVHFTSWADSDPHIGKFQFHVGCNAFGGGVATFFLHCVRDPNVVRDGSQPHTNGNGNGAKRPTADEPPDGSSAARS